MPFYKKSKSNLLDWNKIPRQLPFGEGANFLKKANSLRKRDSRENWKKENAFKGTKRLICFTADERFQG